VAVSARVVPVRLSARSRLRTLTRPAQPAGRRWRVPARALLVHVADPGRPTWQSTSAAAVTAAVAATLAAGPVAGFACAAYASLAVIALIRRRSGAVARSARADLLDRLAGLAADLRAGLPVAAAMSAAGLDGEPDGRLVALVRAAVELAERTGAPLAHLVDRIEVDARAAARAAVSTDAQAAGARATAALLAALPLGGIALGYGIGVDPLAVLLHSPIGAACAAGAVALQVAGLAWSVKLAPGSPR
jgi:tight adherence protein B